MKDEEFQKKLELILEKFEKIDLELKKYFNGDKFNGKHQQFNKSYANNEPILDTKYKKKSSDGK